MKIKDPDEKLREILFGDEDHPASLKSMSKKTKIPYSTLTRHRRYPSSIPLENLRKIVKWNGLDDKEIRGLFE